MTGKELLAILRKIEMTEPALLELGIVTHANNHTATDDPRVAVLGYDSDDPSPTDTEEELIGLLIGNVDVKRLDGCFQVIRTVDGGPELDED